MVRPSSNLDRELILAGKKIIENEGSCGLSIQNICKVANVNTGMFNYHFKTKKNYIKILYNEVRDEIVNYINFQSVSDKSTIEKLRYVIMRMVKYSEENRAFMKYIIIDRLMDYGFNTFVDNGVIHKYEIIYDLLEKGKMEGVLKNTVPTMEMYASIFLGMFGVEIFKSRFTKREKLLNTDGPKFVEFSQEQRMNYILDDYLVK